MDRAHRIPLADVRLSLAEEDEINPSLLVCVEGCDVGCVFCNRPYASPECGQRVASSSSELWAVSSGPDASVATARAVCDGPPCRLDAETILRAEHLTRNLGAAVLQLTGGEPLRYARGLAEFLSDRRTAGAEARKRLPLVLNTSLLVPRESVLAVAPLVDRIIAGAKFGNTECAARLSRVPDACSLYWENLAAVRALGIPLSLRFLVIPGHLECCLKPLLEQAARAAPGVPVTLLTGYMPPVECPEAPEILRLLTREEVLWASGMAEAAGVTYTRSAGAVPRLETADGTWCGKWSTGSLDKIARTGSHHRPSMLAAHSPEHAGGAPMDDHRTTRPCRSEAPTEQRSRWSEMPGQGLELVVDAEGRICFSTYGPVAIELTARAFGRREDDPS